MARAIVPRGTHTSRHVYVAAGTELADLCFTWNDLLPMTLVYSIGTPKRSPSSNDSAGDCSTWNGTSRHVYLAAGTELADLVSRGTIRCRWPSCIRLERLSAGDLFHVERIRRDVCTWQQRPTQLIFVSRGTPRPNGSALLTARTLCFTWNAFDIIVREIAGAKPTFVSRGTIIGRTGGRFLSWVPIRTSAAASRDRRSRASDILRRERKIGGELRYCERGEPHGCSTWNARGQIILQKGEHTCNSVRYFRDSTSRNLGRRPGTETLSWPPRFLRPAAKQWVLFLRRSTGDFGVCKLLIFCA
jgi:hypothetical protein